MDAPHFPPGFRFFSNQDPLAPRVRWALEKIFKLPTAVSEQILSDPDKRVLLRVDTQQELAGFVVFEDYQKIVTSPTNAFVSREDKALLAAPGLRVYRYQQVWFRGDRFPMERILRESLTAMSEILRQEAQRHALVATVTDNETAAPMRAILEDLGFHANANIYLDFAWQLPTDLESTPPATPLPAGFQLRTFASPPEPAAMAEAFNRVFAASHSDLTPAAVSDMTSLATFSTDLSLWVRAPDSAVASFVWVFRSAPTECVLHLLGTVPDYRGRGFVMAGVPAFVHNCVRAGATRLLLTIQHENEKPLRIVRHLGAQPIRQRRNYLRAI